MESTTEAMYKNIYQVLKKKNNIKNIYQMPRIQKIVINVGLGPNIKNEKAKKEIWQSLLDISAQKPIETKAKKSISGFKIREDQIVGYKVTLRKARAIDFLYKLINIILPRVRDFKGISEKSIDKNGNLTIGFKDAFVFPEINREKITTFFGLEICINFKPQARKNVITLLEEFKLPILK